MQMLSVYTAIAMFWGFNLMSGLVVSRPVSKVQGIPCVYIVYADLRASETNFLFQVILREATGCGCHMVWKDRSEFKSVEDSEKNVTAIILAATFGPSDVEQQVLSRTENGQKYIILHHSDEDVVSKDPSIYGNAEHPFRNYYYSGMEPSSIDYLVPGKKCLMHLPKVLWMPLGLAKYKSLPVSSSWEFADRPFLWSWSGSTEGKPERFKMLKALEDHDKWAFLKSRGVLHSFGYFAGLEGDQQDSLDGWEYSMVMQQSQFIPVPAGNSAEQYRVWESLEAGELSHLIIWL
jgi:hypothetical protein